MTSLKRKYLEEMVWNKGHIKFDAFFEGQTVFRQVYQKALQH